MAEKKVYDFNTSKVKTRLVTVLRNNRFESTIADMVGSTGIPKYQITEVVKEVVDEYGGQMKVTESGEVLYYFPQGMRSRYRGKTFKKVISSFLKVTGKALAFLFKAWIMLMLVGYFVLFLLLLLLALFASFAVSTASRGDSGGRSRSRMGGFGTFYLTTRVIELFISLWIYSGAAKGSRQKKTPLYKTVFAFVFGSENPNINWENIEKQAVIRYIQSNKGIISTEELMTITGKNFSEAQRLINRYSMEFEGEPAVTPQGTLYFKFPALMLTKNITSASTGMRPPKKQLIPFNDNKKAANKWIGFLNGFNLVFGSYFLYYGFFVDTIAKTDAWARLYLISSYYISKIADPSWFIPIILGIIPFSFSWLFYLVPLLRRLNERAHNREIKKENLRKKIYKNILGDPENVKLENILPAGKDEAPPNWKKLRETSIKELGAFKGIEVKESGEKQFVYSFPEIKHEIEDLTQFRDSIDLSQYNLGKTVFDSGE
ncbi:MAG: hypothetical protein AB1798_12275 [Spirochaetota bacterium]